MTVLRMNLTFVLGAPAPPPDVVVVVLLMVDAVGLEYVAAGALALVFVGCLYWLLLPEYDATSDCWH